MSEKREPILTQCNPSEKSAKAMDIEDKSDVISRLEKR